MCVNAWRYQKSVAIIEGLLSQSEVLGFARSDTTRVNKQIVQVVVCKPYEA